jgi:hypothetical protein
MSCQTAPQHHICSRNTNYRPSIEDETVLGGNKHPLRVAGQGSIKIQFLLKNSTCTIVLHNVLHVPHLASNIISLCKSNLTILRRILHLDLAKGNPK